MTVAILSLAVVIPVAAAIIWQRVSRALWSSLFFGFGAYAVIGLLRIPLDQVLAIPSIMELISFPLGFLVMKYPPGFILYALIYALFREGSRWLILFFPATSVRTWKEGVMFGLGYSWLAVLQNLGKYVSGFSEEIELNLYSFVEAVEIVSGLGPELTLLIALDRGLAETVFNVGTCLVVMFSVRRRNVWLLLAAVLWNVSYSELSRIVAFSIPGLERGHSYFESLLIIFGPSLTKFLVALLPFLLFFGLRRIKGVRYGDKGDDELEEKVPEVAQEMMD
ncbi:MAG: YhfC family glutamic-type intramembrane protease [Caldilineaceae bacterium]|nr:YhfC family glutamic-type intramembrane protease [Caldilineaceae bacterium]